MNEYDKSDPMFRRIRRFARLGTGERAHSPHSGREEALMRTGAKPLCMAGRLPELEKMVTEGKLVRTRLSCVNHKKERGWLYFYAQPEEVWRLKAVAHLWGEIVLRGEFTVRDHIRLGRLFGYTEQQITAYLVGRQYRLIGQINRAAGGRGTPFSNLFSKMDLAARTEGRRADPEGLLNRDNVRRLDFAPRGP